MISMKNAEQRHKSHKHRKEKGKQREYIKHIDISMLQGL